jgi:hypothetical protein
MLGFDPTDDLLVSSALHNLAGMGDVRAVDTTGLAPPDPIDGHVPDVTGNSYGVPTVAEALTAAQLSDPLTLDKVRAFWPCVFSQDRERSALHLVVERDQADRLRALLFKGGLDPDDDKVPIHTVVLSP